MYDILGRTSIVPTEIPTKMFYPYIERCIDDWEVNI